MKKFISVFFSLILCLSLCLGLLCEGLYFGIQSTLTEKAKSNSYVSELDRKPSVPEKRESSNASEAIDMLRATRQEIDELNLIGITLDDTTLTVVGSALCDILDSCGVNYKRSTVMGIMGDIRDDEDFNLFLYELVVKLLNKKVYTEKEEEYSLSELIEVCENNKDTIERFCREEFRKYDVELTQSLLDNISKKCEEYLKQKVTLSVDDNYVFTHLIEALLRAFRKDISDKVDGYQHSIQAEVAGYIKKVLDESRVDYDPSIVNDIAYDVVNSKKMIGVLQDMASQLLGVAASGKQDVDLAGEIQNAIRKHEKDINDFVRETLKKYNISISGEAADKIDQWCKENLGTGYKFDPNDPKAFSELAAGYIGADFNASTLNAFQQSSGTILEELYGRVPQPVVQAVAYLMSSEHMATIRTIYIVSSVASAVLVLLASTPKCLIFRELGISGIFSGVVLAVVYIGTRIALPRITGENVELIRVMVDNLGKRELTTGIVAACVGVASMIAYSVMYSSYMRTKDISNAHVAQPAAATHAAEAAPAAEPASEPADAPAEEQTQSQVEETPSEEQTPEQPAEPEQEAEAQPEEETKTE